MIRYPKHYARALNMYYRFNPVEGTLTFEDKVTYTLAEAIALSRRKESDEDVRKIHFIKKLFHGLIEEFPYGYKPVVRPPDGEVQKDRAVPAVREVEGKRKQGIPDASQMRLEI